MKYLLLFIVCFAMSAAAYGQMGSLEGTVIDEETGQPIIFGTVAIIKNGQVVTGTDTDLDGFYAITNLLPGLYDVEFSYTGYATQKITDVYVGLLTTKLDAKMTAGQGCYFSFGCFGDSDLFRHDNLTQGMNFSASQIRRMPVIGN